MNPAHESDLSAAVAAMQVNDNQVQYAVLRSDDLFLRSQIFLCRLTAGASNIRVDGVDIRVPTLEETSKAWAEFYALPPGTNAREALESSKRSEPAADTNKSPQDNASSWWQEMLDMHPFLRDIAGADDLSLEEILDVILEHGYHNLEEPFVWFTGSSIVDSEPQQRDDAPDRECAKSPAHSSRGNGVVWDSWES